MAFKLKDGSGVEHTYDQTKLKIPSTTEGETVVFTEGEAQAEKTVDISANGAFEVEPDEGFAFVKKVSGNISVPAPVTSVNGKTGDVKTGMVVNFTVTNGQLQMFRLRMCWLLFKVLPTAFRVLQLIPLIQTMKLTIIHLLNIKLFLRPEGKVRLSFLTVKALKMPWLELLVC